MKNSQTANMKELIYSLQSKSTLSIKRLCDLLLLDLEYNDGKIISDLEENIRVIKELSNEKK